MSSRAQIMSASVTHPTRIAVIGTSGSGKTTLARRIAHTLSISHIELDALHWEPNWVAADRTIFRERVERATQGEAWALDGNYSSVRDIVWPRATTLVWLDYAFALVMWRIIRRTWQRSRRQEELWHGNRESFRMSFLSRDSIIVWALTTYHRRRREYPELFVRPEYNHLHIVHHRRPSETEAWLATLADPVHAAEKRLSV